MWLYVSLFKKKKVGQEALGNTILSTKTGVYISVCGEILSVAFQTSKIQSQSFTKRGVADFRMKAEYGYDYGLRFH